MNEFLYKTKANNESTKEHKRFDNSFPISLTKLPSFGISLSPFWVFYSALHLLLDLGKNLQNSLLEHPTHLQLPITFHQAGLYSHNLHGRFLIEHLTRKKKEKKELDLCHIFFQHLIHLHETTAHYNYPVLFQIHSKLSPDLFF